MITLIHLPHTYTATPSPATALSTCACSRIWQQVETDAHLAGVVRSFASPEQCNRELFETTITLVKNYLDLMCPSCQTRLLRDGLVGLHLMPHDVPQWTQRLLMSTPTEQVETLFEALEFIHPGFAKVPTYPSLLLIASDQHERTVVMDLMNRGTAWSDPAAPSGLLQLPTTVLHLAFGLGSLKALRCIGSCGVIGPHHIQTPQESPIEVATNGTNGLGHDPLLGQTISHSDYSAHTYNPKLSPSEYALWTNSCWDRLLERPDAQEAKEAFLQGYEWFVINQTAFCSTDTRLDIQVSDTKRL